MPKWDTLEYAIQFSKVATVFALLLSAVPILVWLERRGSALIQNRLGPNRVGPLGILQPVADVLKLIFKEESIPAEAHRGLYLLAPVITLLPASVLFAFIPFGDTLTLFGREIVLQIADIPVGLPFIFAISSLGVFGILLAGWSSNNKYSLLGTLRSASQMMSYELSQGLAVMGIVMIFGSLSLREIVQVQGTPWLYGLPKWGIFIQPLGFLIFLAAGFAETNRLPFDLPEGEAELVAGYHTEYGGLKFAMFFMSEYLHIITVSALVTTLYFGGWQLLPGFHWLIQQFAAENQPLALSLFKVASFAIKTAFFIWSFIWIRWTLPRFRYDHLMALGWKVMLPLAFINLFLTGSGIYFKLF